MFSRSCQVYLLVIHVLYALRTTKIASIKLCVGAVLLELFTGVVFQSCFLNRPRRISEVVASLCYTTECIPDMDPLLKAPLPVLNTILMTVRNILSYCVFSYIAHLELSGT